MRNRIIKVTAYLLIIIGVVCIGYDIFCNFKDVDDNQKYIDSVIIQSNDKQTKNNTQNSDNSEFILDWTKIKNQNPDVIAWICIPNTNINYPILKGATNDTYLRHNIYHNYSRSGCIFVSQNNKSPFLDFNTVIYGHNLGNGQMFSQLKNYKNQSFYKSHKYIYIYFPDDTVETYKIISFHVVTDGDLDVYNHETNNYADFKKYITKNNMLNNLFEYEDSEVQNVITLSTCTNYSRSQRYVLHAVKTIK